MPLVAPLSYEQEGLYILNSLDPDTGSFNAGGAYRIEGDLDVCALEQACNTVTARHDSLRTMISVGSDGTPEQIVSLWQWSPLPVVDLSPLVGRGHESHDEIVSRAVEQEQRHPLDLSLGEPLRLRLLKVSPTEHILVVVIHHLLSDSDSEEIFLSEVSEIYSALVNDQTPDLIRPYQFWEHARAQRAASSVRRLRDVQYWVRKLGGSQLLDLPIEWTAEASRGPVVPVVCELNWTSVVKLLDAAAKEAATPFAVLLSLVQFVLKAFTGVSDLSIGCPVSVRDRKTKQSIGLFVNTAVLRAGIADDMSFRSLVSSNSTTILESLRHKQAPFHHVVRAINPRRHGPYTALYNVVASLWRETEVRRNTFRVGDVQASRLRIRRRAPQADLEFLGFLMQSQLVVEIVYDPVRFRRETVESLGSALESLVDTMAQFPDKVVHDVWGFDEWKLSHRVRADVSVAVLDRTAAYAKPSDDVDRSALPETRTETLIAEVWAEFLGLESVHRQDGFFELGGYSLLATQIGMRLQELLGVDVPLGLFFDALTLADFAADVDVLLAKGTDQPDRGC